MTKANRRSRPNCGACSKREPAPRRLLPLLESVGDYHRPFWDTAKEQGWTALALPEAHDGLGLGLIELGLIAHQAGRSLSGAPFLTSGFGAAKAIELYGSDAQKARWLPALASGDSIGAIAFAAGPDTLPAQPDVTFTDDRLSGTARGVSGGLAADVAIVLANGPGMPVLALVDLTGVERTAVPSFDNSRCVADLSFAGAPAETIWRSEPQPAMRRCTSWRYRPSSPRTSRPAAPRC